MKSKKIWKQVVMVGLAVIALAAITVGTVSAQGGGWFGRGEIDAESLLADELGITVEALQAAREAARAKALDQALEKGLITEEQYDNLKVWQALAPYLDRQALLAEALGITTDQLAEKTLGEWLDELDIDRQTLATKVKDAVDAALSRAIEDGVVTQEQVDTMSDRVFVHGFMLDRRGGRFNRHGGCEPGEMFKRRGAPDDDITEDSGFRMPRMMWGNDL